MIKGKSKIDDVFLAVEQHSENKKYTQDVIETNYYRKIFYLCFKFVYAVWSRVQVCCLHQGDVPDGFKGKLDWRQMNCKSWLYLHFERLINLWTPLPKCSVLEIMIEDGVYYISGVELLRCMVQETFIGIMHDSCLLMKKFTKMSGTDYEKCFICLFASYTHKKSDLYKILVNHIEVYFLLCH